MVMPRVYNNNKYRSEILGDTQAQKGDLALGLVVDNA